LAAGRERTWIAVELYQQKKGVLPLPTLSSHLSVSVVTSASKVSMRLRVSGPVSSILCLPTLPHLGWSVESSVLVAYVWSTPRGAKEVGVGDSTLLRVVCYGVLSVIVTVISVVGHDLMLRVQRFMIPTAGLFAIIGVFVFAGDFDSGYRGTHQYALGTFWPTWILSMILVLSTVTSYGSYAGDWSRHHER